MSKTVNIHETDGRNLTEVLPDRPRGGEFFIHLVGDLYRALPTMPKPARRFAYNLIELLENDALSVPAWGDHPTQQPKRLVSYQMSRLEGAMAPAKMLEEA